MSLYAHANEDDQRPATALENAAASPLEALDKLAAYLESVGSVLDGYEAGIVAQVDLERARALYDAWEEARRKA